MMNTLDAAIASTRGHLQAAGLPVGPGLDGEDEERRRRGGGGGDALVGRGRRAASAAGGVRMIAFRPTLLRAGAARPGPGSALAAKARLASGAQPAVVKVASFAGGPARVRSLLDYLSRQGELAVEDENGSPIQGRDQVLGLGGQWSDRFDGRAESRDVVRIELRVASADPAEASELVRCVAGDRPFAFSAEQDGADLKIDLVLGVRSPGDGSRLPLKGSAFADHVERGAGEGAHAQVVASGHAEAGAVRFLDKLIAGAGPERVAESEGRPLATEADVREAAKAWAGTMRPRSPRDIMHLVVSARAGTNREAFRDSVRDYLAVAFPGHRYAFALHQDRPHLHAHAVVTMRGADGSRLHPNITDFHAWRAQFAEAARGHGLEFTATRRHDRAAAPAYKLKHVRAVERGDALEATRRRVALKKADAVVGSRSEQGRAATSAAAQDWERVASELQKSEVQIARQALDRLKWGQALGGAGVADQVLGQMAQGLVREVEMARMTESEAKRGLASIRATAAGVSARFVDQGARQEFDRATGDLVRLVEDRISVQVATSASAGKPSGSTTTSGAAGGGTSAPARGEGGPGPQRDVEDRSAETAREMDETTVRGSERSQTRVTVERGGESGQASGQVATPKEAATGTPAETSEEKLRERIERERAQDRDIER